MPLTERIFHRKECVCLQSSPETFKPNLSEKQAKIQLCGVVRLFAKYKIRDAETRKQFCGQDKELIGFKEHHKFSTPTYHSLFTQHFPCFARNLHIV